MDRWIGPAWWIFFGVEFTRYCLRAYDGEKDDETTSGLYRAQSTALGPENSEKDRTSSDANRSAQIGKAGSGSHSDAPKTPPLPEFESRRNESSRPPQSPASSSSSTRKGKRRPPQRRYSVGARPNEEKGLSELASSGSEEESKPDLKEILLALKKEANGGEVPPELENQLQSLRMEKDRVEEQNRQMQLQTEALMESKAKMKAEKDALERSHNEVLARVDLLEKVFNASDNQGSSEGESVKDGTSLRRKRSRLPSYGSSYLSGELLGQDISGS